MLKAIDGCSLYTTTLALCGLILWYNTGIVNGQGLALAILSKNPIYNGEDETITCSLVVDSVSVLSVTIDSFNQSRKVGTLICNRVEYRNAGTGQFSGYRFAHCSRINVQNPSLNVSIVASTEWDLDFRCTFEVVHSNSHSVWNVTSSLSRLFVFALPEAPTLHPNTLVFNETDDGILICTSRFGWPPAILHLSVTPHYGRPSEQHGSIAVSWIPPSPLKDWHNAKAVCTVQNHNISNMTATGTVGINYITALADSPVSVDTQSGNRLLDCSAHVASSPEATYRWSIPAGTNMLLSESHSSRMLTIPQEQSGFFNCTATNSVTFKEVSIVFHATSAARLVYRRIWEKFAQFGVSTIAVFIILCAITAVCWCFSKTTRQSFHVCYVGEAVVATLFLFLGSTFFSGIVGVNSALVIRNRMVIGTHRKLTTVFFQFFRRSQKILPLGASHVVVLA